ncbi:hypothetical protein AT984_15020 [Paucibacter sp. KCTC 42545]|nr:hypothetical protein AT984_15020 [Paucibacter sp. KCTC 42545]
MAWASTQGRPARSISEYWVALLPGNSREDHSRSAPAAADSVPWLSSGLVGGQAQDVKATLFDSTSTRAKRDL